MERARVGASSPPRMRQTGVGGCGGAYPPPPGHPARRVRDVTHTLDAQGVSFRHYEVGANLRYQGLIHCSAPRHRAQRCAAVETQLICPLLDKQIEGGVVKVHAVICA